MWPGMSQTGLFVKADHSKWAVYRVATCRLACAPACVWRDSDVRRAYCVTYAQEFYWACHELCALSTSFVLCQQTHASACFGFQELLMLLLSLPCFFEVVSIAHSITSR